MRDLQKLHSFGLPSAARNIHYVTDAKQATIAVFDPDSTLVLGEGTNIIFTEHFDGEIVLQRSAGFSLTEQTDGYSIRVQAGHNWHELVTETLRMGIRGLENLALIPGTVGAAPIQNIGAYGAEFKDFCTAVYGTFVDSSETFSLSNKECHFGYRESVFKQTRMRRALITEVELFLPREWQANTNYGGLDDFDAGVTAQAIFERVISIRSKKLPNHKKVGNAGSFFKNPVVSQAHMQQLKQQYPTMPTFVAVQQGVTSELDVRYKIPAAWLIEQCGFKGKVYNGVGCYIKQPLVIINCEPERATGAALLTFARRIRDAVQDKFCIKLQNEVTLMGSTGVIEL